LDAVAVVTSPDAHYPIAMEALNRGLDVICEKPLTVEPEDSWRLVRRADELKRILAVTFTYRFVPDTRRMKEIIDSGELGKVLDIRFISLSGEITDRSEDSESKRYYGNIDIRAKGMVFDCGIHAFDLLCWYAGSRVSRIEALGRPVAGYTHPDGAVAFFEFENGIKAVYDYGKIPYFRLDGMKKDADGPTNVFFKIIVGCENGSLIWNFSERYYEKEFESVLRIYTSDAVRVERFPVYSKKRDLQYQQFIESVKCRKLSGFFPTPEEAARNTEIADKVILLAQQKM